MSKLNYHYSTGNNILMRNDEENIKVFVGLIADQNDDVSIKCLVRVDKIHNRNVKKVNEAF